MLLELDRITGVRFFSTAAVFVALVAVTLYAPHSSELGTSTANRAAAAAVVAATPAYGTEDRSGGQLDICRSVDAKKVQEEQEERASSPSDVWAIGVPSSTSINSTDLSALPSSRSSVISPFERIQSYDAVCDVTTFAPNDDGDVSPLRIAKSAWLSAAKPRREEQPATPPGRLATFTTATSCPVALAAALAHRVQLFERGCSVYAHDEDAGLEAPGCGASRAPVAVRMGEHSFPALVEMWRARAGPAC